MNPMFNHLLETFDHHPPPLNLWLLRGGDTMTQRKLTIYFTVIAATEKF